MKGMKKDDLKLILDELKIYGNVCILNLDLRKYPITNVNMDKLINVVKN